MKPLTIDELKALKVGDWVWYKFIGYNADSYRQIRAKNDSGIDFLSTAFSSYDTYGVEWVCWKNKEQAESRGENERKGVRPIVQSTEYERLTRIDEDGNAVPAHISEFYLEADKEVLDALAEVFEGLAELEDEIENGTLVRLPCKYGDTVYKIDSKVSRILVGEVERIYYEAQVDYKSYSMTADCGNRDKNLPYDEQVIGFIFYPDTDWNVTVFATQAEAEARLAELKGEKR